MSPELRARLSALTQAQIQAINDSDPRPGYFVHARDMYDALIAIESAAYGDAMREIARKTLEHIQSPWRK